MGSLDLSVCVCVQGKDWQVIAFCYWIKLCLDTWFGGINFHLARHKFFIVSTEGKPSFHFCAVLVI